jgi:hypothetical protein
MMKYIINKPERFLSKAIVRSFSPIKILAFNNSLDALPQPQNSTSSIPAWVQNLNEIGRKGEFLAFKYLSKSYNSVSWVSDNAKLGYDIVADNEYFEIKTTENGNGFFISQNELIKAYKYCERYHIIFIKNLSTYPKGFFIDDVFKTFNLSFDLLNEKSNIISNAHISIESVTFKITFEGNYINKLKKIDFSEI